MDEGNDLERLIKLLKKTQGSNDHESLMAIRMTNTFLERKGWDWDRLLRGKIRVVADPFSLVKPIPKAEPAPMPTATRTRAQQDATLRDSIRAKQAADIRAAQAAQDARDADIQQRQRDQDLWNKGWPSSPNANRPNPFQAPRVRISPLRANKYPGHCWQCGYYVDRNAGHIFRAGSVATTTWEILCVPCEAATLGATRQVSPTRAITKNSPPPGTIPNVDQL